MNSHVAYGDIILELNAGIVLFRTYERFWDEHTFNPDVFLDSMQTGLSSNIQIRAFDDGWYRIYAIWPDDINADIDMDPIIEYVANSAVSDYNYVRLKVSTEDGIIYYVSDVYINDISELTDEIFDAIITGTALRITEKYGPDIMEIISEQE